MQYQTDFVLAGRSRGERRLNGLDFSFQLFASLIRVGAVRPSQKKVTSLPSMTGLPDWRARKSFELEAVIC